MRKSRRWTDRVLIFMVAAFAVGFVHVMVEVGHEDHYADCQICVFLSQGVCFSGDSQGGVADGEESISLGSTGREVPRANTEFPAFFLRGPPAFS
ncbi:MAG: hypothetical protein QF752_17365 [Planctomycetota bacterium]|nr:hypothetical protein [Planctomycetota bacterium]